MRRAAIVIAFLGMTTPMAARAQDEARAVHAVDGTASIDRIALDHLAASQLALAEDAARRAIAMHAEYAPAHNTLGLVHVRRGDPVSARDSFVRARELDPTLFAAHMNEGALALDVRDFEAARTAFLHAIEIRPRDYDAWISHGVARRGLNDFEGARAAYEQALLIDDTRPEAYLDLGLLLQSRGDATYEMLAQAVSHFHAFIQRAGSRSEYAAAVQMVLSLCSPDPRTPRRRRPFGCRGGIGPSRGSMILPIEFMREAAVMQAEMARIQRQAPAAAARQTTVDAARAFLSAATRSIGER